MRRLIVAGDQRFLDEMMKVDAEILFIARQPADLHRALLQNTGYDEIVLGFEPEVSIQLLRNLPGARNVAIVFDRSDDMQKYGLKVMELGGSPMLFDDVLRRFGTSKNGKGNTPLPVPQNVVEEELKAREARSPVVDPTAAKMTVLSVYAPKGGVGKTTFSAYLAAHLALLGKKVVGIDADSGKVGADLGRRFGFFVRKEGMSYKNILDFMTFPLEDYFKWDVVRSYLVSVKDFNNLYLVLNPARASDLGYGYDVIERATSILRYHFDYTILDLSPLPSQTNLDVFTRLADRVFLLVTPDPAVIDGARTFLDSAIAAGAVPDKFHLVINMHGKNDPHMTKIAQHVGLPVRAESVFPLDNAFVEHRVRMATVTPKAVTTTPFGKAMERFVKMHFAEQKDKPAPKKKRFLFF